MKFLVISDIHGSPVYLEKVLNIFESNNHDKLILLGDELYHGPRNPIPEGYNPKKVIEMLNQYKEKIIAVRGNCDSEVDQMMLNFPIMSDYHLIIWNNKKIFITHGHIYNKDNPLPLEKGDILLYGHFHIPMIIEENNHFFLNPGSITLPKENSPHCYGSFENNSFIIRDTNQNIILKKDF